MNEDESRIYAGLCEVTYEGEPFDLGHGIVLRSTYAHLFAAPMMAFARAPEGRHHPSPWRAAQGGFSHDIEAELSVPASGNLPAGLTGEDTAQLLASLLRLAGYPYLTIPVISDHAFDAAATAKEEPILRPLEIDRRIISAASPDITKLKHSVLDWVRSVWPATAALMKENRKFRNALWAIDACTIAGHTASALLLAWGALEELFAPSRSEIRYRISANIAAFLEPIGSTRLTLFREVRELYDARSKVAHTAQDADVSDLLRTFVILRNALLKIVRNGSTPTPQDLEEALFLSPPTHATKGL